MANPQRSAVNVYTNSFQILSLPTKSYFHFDEIIPVRMPTGPGAARGMPKSRAYEIMDRLQADNAEIFNPRPVFDGRRNLFSRRSIEHERFLVYMGRDRSKHTHEVTLKRVAIIDPNAVRNLTQRQQPGNTASDAMSLNLLQLIIRQAPNMRHHFPPDARSFYIEPRRPEFLGGGLVAWRGFFQSIRPTMGRLIVNVDVSNAAVYSSGNLVDVMMQHVGVTDPRALQGLPNDRYQRLRMFLKRVRVKNDTRPNDRARPISDLVPEAGLQEFHNDAGEQLSVQRHFKDKYNKQVRFPSIPGVRIGSKSIIPAEFCFVIPGQVYRKKLSPDAQSRFIKFATQRPEARFKEITDAVKNNEFNYTDSDYMRDSGMGVNAQPLTISAERISPPRIEYGNRQVMEVKGGAWNVLHKTFFAPRNLEVWGVVVFDDRGGRDEMRVQSFVKDLRTNLQKLGMTVKEPITPQWGNCQNVEGALENVLYLIGEKCNKRWPQLILAILPANAAECRRIVKHWGDIKRTVPTQCVRGGKWDSTRGRDQYCNNVALKINTRLGGRNSVIRSSLAQFLQETMIIGADVGHPSPGMDHRPSVTGLVASVDPTTNVITSYTNVQRPRLEIIQDLQEMVAGAIRDWRSWRTEKLRGYDHMPPKNIVFYRDGVSEGEFAHVIQQEIPMIEAAFIHHNIPEQIRPKILFVVVGKRHHHRFFPTQERDADRSGNCLPGLLIDSQITHPNYDDFYLQSHAGLLGTSRPAHYVILKNDTSLTTKQVQTLTFELCHTYASATRSVSIPAPVYYADKICSRLEFHVENGASLSDTASNVTGDAYGFDLDQWKAWFKKTKLDKQMYFI